MKDIELDIIKKKFLPFFKNKKILITGGTGLIGREILNFLKHCRVKEIKVISLDKIKLKIKNVKFIHGDLCDFHFCRQVTKNIDYVFHIAGIKGSIKVTLEKPASFFVPLLMMNTNILEASRINKVKRLIYTSSIGAYTNGSKLVESNIENGEPMDTYPGYAKRMAELQIQSYKKQYKLKNYFVVRPCNVFGPGDNFDKNNAMVIPSLISKIVEKSSKVEIWGDGKSVRDFLFSRDAARGIILTLIKGTGKESFLNLGSGKGFSIKELVVSLRTFINFNYFFDKSKASGYSSRVLSMKKSIKILKFKPIYSLNEGLKETYHWYLKNKKQSKFRKNYFTK